MQDFPTIDTVAQGLDAISQAVHTHALTIMLSNPRLSIDKAMCAAAGKFYIQFLHESGAPEAPNLLPDTEPALLSHLEAIAGWKPNPKQDDSVDAVEHPAPTSDSAEHETEVAGTVRVLLSVTKRGKLYVIRYAPTLLASKPLRIEVMRLAASAGEYVEPSKSLAPFADRCWKAGLLDRNPESAKKFRINDAGKAWLEQFSR